MEHFTRLSELRADLTGGKLQLTDLVKQYVDKIEDKKDLNIFLEVFGDEAMHQAAIVQAKLDDGSAGRLAGMVIAIKDNICYKGHKVTASSKILEGFESLYTATALQRLLDEDVIVIGRTNCDEFAMGSSNENSAYGSVKSPVREDLVPGGSSGGSGAAVAAGMCMASLGSETGGSVRQPASFCGIVGMKPSYGRISRYGLIAYASSFDQISPFGQSVEDVALLCEIMAGKDEKDSTSSSVEVADCTKSLGSKKKFKIAYIEDCLESDGLQREVKSAMEETIGKLKADGHEVEPVRFPYLDHMIPTYYVLTTAEASSNLARFDGIGYGHRSSLATDIDSTYVKSRSEGFGDEVKRRIMLGTFVLSAGYYDAYYGKAQKARRLLKEATDEILSIYDFILLPSTPTSAFKLDSVKDPIAMYLQDIFTVQANLVGIPAISVPMFKDDEGLPFGLQIMGRKFEEAELFQMAAQLEAY